MSSVVEKEFKSLLTLEQYNRIKSDYASILTRSFTQTNTYFDAHQQLANAKCALRIRTVEQQETGEVTLKIPQSPYEVLEISETFPVKQLQTWMTAGHFSLSPTLQQTLAAHNLSLTTVQQTTTLITHRLEGHLRSGSLLVLDKSQYSGITDYELELEVDDLLKGKELFDTLLARYDIQPVPSPSKVMRALQASKSTLS